MPSAEYVQCPRCGHHVAPEQGGKPNWVHKVNGLPSCEPPDLTHYRPSDAEWDRLPAWVRNQLDPGSAESAPIDSSEETDA